jgi:hypothetical protein
MVFAMKFARCLVVDEAGERYDDKPYVSSTYTHLDRAEQPCRSCHLLFTGVPLTCELAGSSCPPRAMQSTHPCLLDDNVMRVCGAGGVLRAWTGWLGRGEGNAKEESTAGDNA